MWNPFELNLRYLWQRKYRYRIGWPLCDLDLCDPRSQSQLWHWITKICFSAQKVRSTHPVTSKLCSYIPLVLLITWLNFGVFRRRFFYFLAATKQLYKWYFPSVCPSVCHTFFTMFPSSYHHEIFRSYYHGQKWCPCKRSRSEVKGQGHRGQHPT